MDVRSLLYGYRAATREDLHRKALALRSGFTIAKSRGYEGSLPEFVETAGTLGTHCFGNDGHDSYVTTALSVVAVFQPIADLFMAAVMNSIVVQMNFQSRQVIDGVSALPEVVVFDGAEDYFAPAMIHGNFTGGILIGDRSEAYEAPTWAQDNATLEIATGHVIRSHIDHLGQNMESLGRSRIGALLLSPVAMSRSIGVRSRFDAIGPFTTKHTIYCFTGSAESVVATTEDLQRRHPEAGIDLRLYDISIGGALEYRAIAIAHGLSGLPDVTLNSVVSRPTRFVEAMNDYRKIDGVTIVNYFDRMGIDDGQSPAGELAEIGSWEAAPVRRPFLLSSSAPLPEEARERVSDATEVFHSLVILNRGILVPSQDASHAIYLHATGNAEIVMDYGDEGRNAVSTPIYRDSIITETGERIGYITTGSLIRVAGAAMPLMFTPLLHKWYSHFIIQCLPRVRIAREMGRAVKLLLPSDMRQKQLEMLATLGFGDDDIVRMPPGSIVQADELIVPRAWRLAFTPYSAAIYDEIAISLDTRSIDTPRRVLISRESRKTWRNMLNYEAVKSLLTTDYGFEVVSPEKLTLQEEVATYANAEIVVGAEGAGMYGAVFSKPGTIYLTLCDEDYVMPILGTLAHIRNIDIGYVFGESLRADADIERRLPYGHADFVVDLQRVEQATQAAIRLADAMRGGGNLATLGQ